MLTMLIRVFVSVLCIIHPLVCRIIRILLTKGNLPVPLVTHPTGSENRRVTEYFILCVFKRYFCVNKKEFLQAAHFSFLFNLLTNAI